MTRRISLVAVAVALGACFVPAAQGASWKRLTPSTGGSSIDQVGLVRTGDGVLHAAWRVRTGPNTEDVRHTVISPGGNIGATSVIAGSWAIVTNPALVAVPGGLWAFYGGIRTTNPGETNQELNGSLSTDGGANWALQAGSLVPLGAQAYAYPVAATVLPNGTPLQAWAGSLGTWVHAGLSPASPNHNLQASLGNYGYDVNLASDASGAAMAAWYSNATGHLGVHAQAIGADGAPAGPVMRMPNTSNMASGMLGRTPLVARVGGGFYVAYPTGSPTNNRVRLWRVGSSTARLIASTRSNSAVALAAAPDGRLWIAWTDTVNFKPVIYARRSNKAGTVFGARVSASRPTGALSLYRVDANATSKALDLFGTFGIGTSSNASTYYRRILPGLTVTASRSRVTRGVPTSVTFRVLDAGSPVKGARVRVGNRSATTNSQGRATLTVTGTGTKVKATGSKTGYVSGSVSLSVRS